MPVKLATPLEPTEYERALPPDPIPPKPPEYYMPEESVAYDKPFYPQKPIPHSAKISPSSIPNPNPSITTMTQMEPGYPSYGGYLYSIPGYSAFQPVAHTKTGQPSQPPPIQNETTNPEYVPFPTTPQEPLSTPAVEEQSMDTETSKEIQKTQTDFEEHFTPEIVTAPSIPDDNKTQNTESKMSITSLAQGSGATITIPSQILNRDIKKPERFSLKTSIPISKIDLKYVNNPPDSAFQNSLTKKPFNTSFAKEKPRVEIMSNIVIKPATMEPEVKDTISNIPPNNSISTLINAAEITNKIENQSSLPEPKIIDNTPTEVKDPPTLQRPIFNPINIEPSKTNISKPPEPSSNNEQKNQIVLIQNKNNSNSKMLLIQPQNPQVLLQRTNFDSKNVPVPSRVSSQSKKCKEDVMKEGSSSKVVALKRLHEENCDENDFENLITENQIYGSKIVVKEKSQGTLQEQDIKNKKEADKVVPTETKNVVLQPNFVYLSNVQFPANLMMIKNNSKVTQTTDTIKMKIAPNENKVNESTIEPNIEANSGNKTPTNNATVCKDIHVLKSNNNVLQTLPNKTKSDLIFQTNQKVIMNSQIVSSIVSYQVPITTIAEGDKVNQSFIKPKFMTQKKEFPKPFDHSKSNDKLYIACPYQMDSKLQPKIVITNIRPKGSLEGMSALDLYEKRKRMRRLKYLAKHENKDVKTNAKKAIKIDAKNDIKTDVEKDVKTDAKKDVKTDTTKDFKTDGKTDIIIDVKKDLKTDNNEDVKNDVKNEIKTASKKDVTTDLIKVNKNKSRIVTKIPLAKLKQEISKNTVNTQVVKDYGSSGSDTDDYGEEDLKMYEDIIEEYGSKPDKDKGKAAFMASLSLATPDAFKGKFL